MGQENRKGRPLSILDRARWGKFERTQDARIPPKRYEGILIYMI